MANISKIDFTRVNNDVNGNPRMVVHFLQLLTKEELNSNLLPLGIKYDLALIRAKTVGGKKYHNKYYGGGIVFQEYESCLDATVNRAFESFEQSKAYNDALNKIVLTVVNSQDTYTKALELCKVMHKKGALYVPCGFEMISEICSDTADMMRKKYSVRVSSSAVWIAAVYVVLSLEEEALEQSNQG